MISPPFGAPAPALDARWIIALWVAIHGGRSVPGGETTLEPATVRAAAGNAILALTDYLDAEAALAIRTALLALPGGPTAVSDADVEDALKRLGIRLYDQPAINGVSVAGFGKISWPVDAI